MTEQRADVLFGAAGLLTTEHRKALVDLAAKRRIPAIWGERQFVEAGGLMSYAVDSYDEVRGAAI
jgi:putative ABC transport system substrate-binding protein